MLGKPGKHILNQYPAVKLSATEWVYCKHFKSSVWTGKMGGISLHIVTFLNIVYIDIRRRYA